MIKQDLFVDERLPHYTDITPNHHPYYYWLSVKRYEKDMVKQIMILDKVGLDVDKIPTRAEQQKNMGVIA